MTSLETVQSVCPLCLEPPSEAHAAGPDFEYDTTPGTEWSLKRCIRCDVVMLAPRPAESALGTIYPSNYYAFDFSGKPSLGRRVKTLLDRRTIGTYLGYAPKDAAILDVGCGDGRLLHLFAGRGVPKERLYGMELNARAVEAAKARGLNVVLGRFEDVDYPQDFFGLAVMQQVIEHVSDPRDVLTRLHRLLAPGGALVLETPNTASWDHRLFQKRHWGGYHIPRHFFLFNPGSLTKLLEDCGYRVVASKSLASPSFWILSVHHRLAERGAPGFLLRFFDSTLPNPLALVAFTLLDGLGKMLGITSNMRIVAVKA